MNTPGLPHSPVVAVGMFDGVHVAHQQLIRTTVRLARRLQRPSLVITFDPDPQLVLSRANQPLALMPLEERIRWLRALGIEQVWVIPFTKQFSRVTAKQFIQHILIGRLRAVALVVGETFAFGKRRLGTLKTLQAIGPRYKMRIVAVPPIQRGGQPVSSSRIRRLIAEGNLASAAQLLGRSPALYGHVVSGAGRGQRLGIPTANLKLLPQVLPPPGVYAVRVQTRSRTRQWKGVMNLGVRPTFGPGPLVCEVHLINFHGNLRGTPVVVSLWRRLRNERCFESSAALVRQIRQDITRARRLLSPSHT